MRALPTTLQRGYYPLDDGSEARPAAFFRRESGTGWFRRVAGAFGISVNRQRVFEITGHDAFVRSFDPAATISPLTIERVNAMTADGQETCFDWMEANQVVGRLHLFREGSGDPTARGWRFQGSNNGTLGGFGLQILSAGDVLVGRDLVAARNLNASGSISAGGDISTPTNLLGGNTYLTTPSGSSSVQLMLRNANSSLYGLVNLNPDGSTTFHAATGELALASRGVVRYRLWNGYQSWYATGSGEIMRQYDGGQLLITVPGWNPLARFQVNTDAAGDGIMCTANEGGAPAFKLQNLAGSRVGLLGLGTANGQFLGSASDLSLFTAGSAPGRLILGTSSQPRLLLDVNGDVTFNTYQYGGVRFALKQKSNAPGGGYRLIWANDDSRVLDEYIGSDGRVYWQYNGSPNGFCFNSGNNSLEPLSGPGSGGVGSVATPFSSAVFNYVLIGATNFGYRLNMGVDSAYKPTTATWATNSDARAKYADSIAPYTRGLAELRRLRPISYRYNGRYGLPDQGPDETPGVGVIAQELAEVVPSMVAWRSMAIDPRDPDGPREEVAINNYHELLFMLTNAVVELAERLETLEGASG